MTSPSRATTQYAPATTSSCHGDGPAKLLEYNADTPTSLYESAVFQWVWLEEMRDAIDSRIANPILYASGDASEGSSGSLR